MTQKEKTDIGISISILMEIILNKDADSENVANHSITFCREMLNTYPEIRNIVDSIMTDFDSDSEGFNEKWERQIAWIDWETNMLK